MIYLGIGFWVFLIVVVGFIGQHRKIGFAGAVLLALLFTPFVAVICTFLSPTE